MLATDVTAMTQILWVDDSPNSARSLRLRDDAGSQGFAISVASNMQEVADRLLAQNIQALIIDLSFASTPEVSGIALARKLRPSMPIVAMSYVPFQDYYGDEIPKVARFADLTISPDSSGRIRHFRSILDALKQEFARDEQSENLVEPIRNELVVVNDRLADFFRSDPQALRTISPRQFEELIADLLRKSGYDVSLTPATRDGGRDVIAFKKQLVQNAMLFVECKRYVPPTKVGVGVARELYGAVERARATGGIIATTSYFTRDAQEFASAVPYRLFLLNFDDINAWLKANDPTSQPSAL